MNQNQDFYWWFEERLKYTKIKHSYHTWRNVNAAYRKLKEFRPSLTIHEVDYKFLRDFEAFLISQGLSTNTVGEKLIRIKTITNELLKSYVIERNPFARFSIDFARTKKARISIEDIHKLERVCLEGQPAIARDMYIFSFYCAGVRFGDLCRMKKTMIKDGFLNYTMHKSLNCKIPMERSIKLVAPALRIAYKYPGERIFDLDINWADEDKNINSKNAIYNKMLKKACYAAGVIDLSFHTSRNSFADHCVRVNVDLFTTKSLLGHRKTSTTEVYLQDFYKEKTEEAMDRLFG